MYPRTMATIALAVVLSAAWATIGYRWGKASNATEIIELHNKLTTMQIKLYQEEQKFAKMANERSTLLENQLKSQQVIYKTQVKYVDRIVEKHPDLQALRLPDDVVRLWNSANAGLVQADNTGKHANGVPKP